METRLALSITAVSILLLVLAPFATPTVLAHHRDGHTGGPGGNGGGGEESATIELIVCDDNTSIAKWRDPTSPDGLKDTITYKIVNVSGVSADVIQAVRDGVEEWDTVKGQDIPDSPYELMEVTSGDADITISIFFKIVPGFILGFAAVNCPGADGIQSVDISLGVKGLSTNGAKNLAAHEVGHGLGLGHTTNKNNDLMGPSLDAKERKNLVCPSNLDIEALTQEATTYTINDWTLLNC